MEEIKEEKLKALKVTLDRLDKSFGKGAVMRLGDEPVEKMEVKTTTLLVILSINIDSS